MVHRGGSQPSDLLQGRRFSGILDCLNLVVSHRVLEKARCKKASRVDEKWNLMEGGVS